MTPLRLAAICSSLGLLIGCVWFAQKQANPTRMPSSKLRVLPAPNASVATAMIPGSKSGTLIMSGSKSFTGPTINAKALQSSPSPQPAKP
jgi:hypothetical protein